VVGILKHPLDRLPFVKQPLYTINVKRTMPFRES
jgi:hypothetical protein